MEVLLVSDKVGKSKKLNVEYIHKATLKAKLVLPQKGKLENIGISFPMELKSAQPEGLEQG